MEVPKVFESEYRLCLILWEHEPIKSSELVQLCREHGFISVSLGKRILRTETASLAMLSILMYEKEAL